MLKYKFFKQVGDCVCSIDNMVLYFYSLRHDDIIKYVRANFDTDSSSYYELLDKTPSSKYQYWKDHIHCGNLYIKLGKYVYQKDSKRFDSCDIISFEINPNKHSDSIEYKIMEDLINLYCEGGGWIHQIDFAIDVPCFFDDLILFPEGRKMPGLYKGTKYFGTHNMNGFVKAYDKMKESKLDDPLSRVEITYKPIPSNFPSLPFGEIKEPFQIIPFGVVDITYKQELKGQMKSLAMAVKMLESAQLPTDIVLKPLGYRQRVKIQEAVAGGVRKIEIKEDTVRDLINMITDTYSILPYSAPDSKYSKKTQTFYFTDLITDDTEIPF